MLAFQRPYWDPCYSPVIFILGSDLISLLPAADLCEKWQWRWYVDNLTLPMSHLVWIWNPSLNNESETCEQQVCTYVKRNCALLLNLMLCCGDKLNQGCSPSLWQEWKWLHPDGGLLFHRLRVSNWTRKNTDFYLRMVKSIPPCFFIVLTACVVTNATKQTRVLLKLTAHGV